MASKWILIVIDHKVGKWKLKAIDVFRDRVKRGFWAINPETPNFKNLRKGDIALFYLGGKDGQKFVGKGILASEPHAVTQEQMRSLIGEPSSFFTCVVELDQIDVWDPPVPLDWVIQELSFIEKKDKWGVHFQGTIKSLSNQDYDIIENARKKMFQESMLSTESVTQILQTSRKIIEEFNFRKLCSEIQKTTYFTHGFFPYPAKFIPQIPRYFIKNYTSKEAVVLDPFCGCGTTLVEAKLLGRDSFGVDINPLAQLLTRVKTTPLEQSELEKEASLLLQKIREYKGEPCKVDFPNKDFWFEKNVQEELGIIKACINEIPKKEIQEFFLVCFASIIRKCSNADPKISKPVFTKRMRGLKDRKIEPLRYFEEKVKEYCNQMVAFSTYLNCYFEKSAKAEVIGKDARKIELGDESVNLIVTSPPFMNAQEYFRTTKFEIYWTGLAEAEEIRNLERQLIGVERVSNHEYAELHLTNNLRLDDIIKKIYDVDKQRAYILYQYFVEMGKAFKEFHRILAKSGCFVITIGDNIVRKIPVPTHELIIDIAENNAGFKCERVGYDVIKAHALMTKRNITGGVMNVEWAMVLRKL